MFKPGTVLASAVAITAQIPIAGAGSGRFYAKANVAITVDYYYLRPDGLTRYVHQPQTQGAAAATVELSDPLTFDGEAWLEVVLTPGDNGVLDYADIALLENA